jgi:threonine synthase
MGAPIERLVIGSNRNDILTRWVETGSLVAGEVVPTISPSMDIQVSSNLERVLFELLDRDGRHTAELMGRFRALGSVEMPRDEAFEAARVDDDQTRSEIRSVYRGHGYLMDPHTAVGLHAAFQAGYVDGRTPLVCLATAHPAKFPDAVEQATGVRPSLPEALADLLDRPEHYDLLPADLGAVRSFLRARVG